MTRRRNRKVTVLSKAPAGRQSLRIEPVSARREAHELLRRDPKRENHQADDDRQPNLPGALKLYSRRK